MTSERQSRLPFMEFALDNEREKLRLEAMEAAKPIEQRRAELWMRTYETIMQMPCVKGCTLSGYIKESDRLTITVDHHAPETVTQDIRTAAERLCPMLLSFIDIEWSQATAAQDADKPFVSVVFPEDAEEAEAA